MAISTIGGAASSGSSAGAANWVNVTAANNAYLVTATLPAGVYRVRAYAATLQATPVATVSFLDGSKNVIRLVQTIDNNSADSWNFSENYAIITTSNIAFVSVTSNAAGYVSIENTGNSVGTLLTISSFTSSQTVVTSANANVVLLAGGGGGGMGAGSTGQVGAGGGGSGNIQRFTMGAGSNALVIGAGGAGSTTPATAGAAGGASTFNGFTAVGGSAGAGGNNGAGGAGGSGGGNQGQNGGSNGSGGTTMGAGSGVALPYWATAPGAGGTFQNNGGSSGGFYAGGGGAGNVGGAAGTSYPAAAANTGGGGGGSASCTGGIQSGASGGSGILLVAYGV